MIKQRKICYLAGMGLFVLLFTASLGIAQDMTSYCCAPPFVTTVVPPNILMSLDNSGSMFDRAYSGNTLLMTDTTKWYGYFKPESMYVWNSNHFESSPTGIWPGRVLNWAAMCRADVAKKVLTGGKGNIVAGKARLISEGRNGSWPTLYYRRDAANYNTITINHGPTNNTTITVTRTGVNPPINATMSGLDATVDIPEIEYRGVLDQIGDKDDNRHWDDDAPLFGLWHYNTDEGGHIRDYIGDPDIIDMRNHVNEVVCNTWTPLAENYFEILHYFSQSPNRHYYNSDYTPNPGGLHDPYYDKRIHDMVPCRRSFVLMITDGESTEDLNIPNSDLAHMPFATGLRDYDGDGNDPGSYPSNGSDFLDDICLYGHVNDMRPDSGTGWGNRELNGNQEVTCFVIYAFGTSGSQLLKDAAQNGGFEDRNGNKRPDLAIEWDEDGDGIPDNYYEATNGYELEQAILNAIMEMMARISSGSGAAVVTQGGAGGGITAQGQFFPRRYYPTGEMLDWVGNLYSLWLDEFGLIREDTDQNHIMGMTQDYVIGNMFYNGTDVMAPLYRDEFGNGESLTYINDVPVMNLKTVWDGGRLLYLAAPANRTIKTFVDANKNHFVDAGEIIDFATSNTATLRPYLGVATNGAADTTINYVRGQDFTGLRTRTVQGSTWKLGDIINSSPVPMGAPPERYDYIYGDMTYLDYYTAYEFRRPVLYGGANDGMLHAFNAGLYDPNTRHLDGLGRALGEELWAFVPYNLLPHVKWLQNPKYCHVYYNDMKTYISDAKIFSDDAKHPRGWGTVLIGAMRMGGGSIAIATDTCRSAYFAIDITDPLDPVPMWEWHDDSLNYTTCYSTMLKVGNRWFLALGSGPVTCGGEITREARIYILDMATGALEREFTFGEANSFVSDIFALDWNTDYNVDFIYFGTCQKDAAVPGGYGGKIYRINTLADANVNNWTWNLLMNMQRPITAEGSVAKDVEGHRWVYYGSGRFYSDVDEGDMTQQIFVGFRDDTTNTTNPFNLYNVTGIEIDTNGDAHLPSTAVITFDSLTDAVSNRLGWYRYLDASDGERSLTTTLVYGGAVMFTTFSPTGDVCSYGGQGFLYALYYRTGTAYRDTIIGDTLGYNRFRLSLGAGMPSEPVIYLNQIILQRAGEIDKYEWTAPELPRTGLILWKGK